MIEEGVLDTVATAHADKDMFVRELLTKEAIATFLQATKYEEYCSNHEDIDVDEMVELWYSKEKICNVARKHWQKIFYPWLKDHVIPFMLKRVRAVAEKKQEERMQLLRGSAGLGAEDVRQRRLDDLVRGGMCGCACGRLPVSL